MYDVAKSRLETQLTFIDAVDTKIGMLISLATALLGIAAAVFALHSTQQAAPALTAPDLGILIVGGAVYIALSIAGLWAYFAREWNIGPDLDSVWSRHKSGQSPDRLKWEVANDFIHYYEDNLGACELKNQSLPWIFAGVIAEALLLVSALSLVAAGS